MKKIVTFLLASLVLALALATAVAAADVIYVDYAGNDANNGFTQDAAKKTPTAAAEALPNGGIMLVTGKAYTHKSGAYPAWDGTLTITSAYGGRDYKNPAPANNPACAFKMGSGVKLTFVSDVVFDDIILFQENNRNTVIVAKGATLTVNANVVSMSNHSYYWDIVVEEGGKAILNGGIFSNVSGAGEIVIGEGATVLEGEHAPVLPAEGKPEVVFQKYGGKNENDGKTPATAKGTFGSASENGSMGTLTYGGTLVGVGKLFVGTNYSMPRLQGPLTITCVYDGVDYKNPEPANNPACAFKMGSAVRLTVQSDVIFDNVILFQENEQNKIRVTEGATLTVTDTVQFMSNHDYHYIIEVEAGAVAILSEEAQKRFEVRNNGGTVLTYGVPAAQTVVRLTIGSKNGEVNGRIKVLDAAPMIRNSRTMLPVRFVAENLGGTVGWDGATSTVTVKGEGIDIAIRIGASTAEINGKTVALDSPAFIENSRTYLPVRVVAEAMGASVAWDGETSTATLTK